MSGINNNDGRAGGVAEHLLDHRLSESNENKLELHLEVGKQGLTRYTLGHE